MSIPPSLPCAESTSRASGSASCWLCSASPDSRAPRRSGTRSHPLKTIPRALIQSTLLSGLFFIVGSYVEVLGFPASAGTLDQSDAPITVLAEAVGIRPLGRFIDVGVMVTMFACTLACITAAARVLMLMGHNGLAHEGMAAIHQRNQDALHSDRRHRPSSRFSPPLRSWRGTSAARRSTTGWVRWRSTASSPCTRWWRWRCPSTSGGSKKAALQHPSSRRSLRRCHGGRARGDALSDPRGPRRTWLPYYFLLFS